MMKIKQSKEFKKRKFEEKKKRKKKDAKGDSDFDGDDDDYDEDDEDAIAREMLYKKSQPLPGQLENCEICEKRFTVTAYSKTGPEGGLLCPKCSREMKQEEAKRQPKKKGPARGKRRQTESDRMMGEPDQGPLSLVEICVRKVAANIVDIDEFGDLPQHLLDRLSQILSQRRAIDSRTLQLFLKADSTKIDIYDAAKLETDDFQKIFSFMPELEHVNLRNAGQMKDEVLLYMLDQCPHVRHLQLGAANLITNDAWRKVFERQGRKLATFKVADLDAAMDDAAIQSLVRYSNNTLTRLKVRNCWKTTEASIASLSDLTNLQHLSLSISPDASSPVLVDLVKNVGPHLQTLLLENYRHADDDVLDAIHQSCRQLTKLRFSNNALVVDAAFERLFSNWSNPGLIHVDFSDVRAITEQNADGEPDTAVVGLASSGLEALLRHSGSTLQILNLKACRHISRATLLDLFDPHLSAEDKARSTMASVTATATASASTSRPRAAPGLRTYPQLRDIDLSFVSQTDATVVAAIFQSCPNLRKLAVFGCHEVGAGAVNVPAGVAVIGLMNAMQEVVLEGDGDGE